MTAPTALEKVSSLRPTKWFERSRCSYVEKDGTICSSKSTRSSMFCAKHQTTMAVALSEMADDAAIEDKIPLSQQRSANILEVQIRRIQECTEFTEKDRIRLTIAAASEAARIHKDTAFAIESLERNKARRVIYNFLVVFFKIIRKYVRDPKIQALIVRDMREAASMPLDPGEIREVIEVDPDEDLVEEEPE